MRDTVRVDDRRRHAGQMIRARREELNYPSQRALADASGASLRMVAAAENGEHVGTKTLRRIERALRWRLGDLDHVIAGTATEPTEVAEREPAESGPETIIDAVADLVRVLGEEETKAYLASLVERTARQDPPRDRASGE